MTTSDFGGGSLAAAEALAAQLAGAIDPGLIAQLANRYFSALPGQDAAPAALIAPAKPASPVVPAAAPARIPFAAPATLPSGGYYFIDEVLAAGSSRQPPFRFDSFAVSPEVVEHVPTNIPDLGFGARPFDPRAIRRDFPILNEQVNGRPLIWLDNAATTQKPQAVIDRLSFFYEHENSNIHRAAHALAARATDAYEAAREKVRRFINASSTEEIVFVRGTTEAINLIAQSWGRRNVEAGDEIVITWLEHHANIVPWQQLAAEKGARLRVAPVDDDGQIILEEYEKLFNARTKIAAFTQVSNALGTVAPTREMVEIAHRHGALALVDGAQSVSHMRTDVQALGADFFVFSGHKVFAPTGIGVVYGRKDILDATPPWQGGGNMIADVTFEKTLYQPAPAKFEAGTGNIADAVGLGAALDYVSAVGIDHINRYEHELIAYATRGLLTVPGLSIVGKAKEKAGVISFVLDGFRTEDVGKALDREGIAVRSGHHCAQPILRRFGYESTVRPSFAPYNTCEDIDALVTALLRIQSGQRSH
ncbi:MAG: cysteine desulfurase [Rhodocyclales bacterium]|nr:cysteine desulfurase [Rhodocyclales bacterium]